MTFIKEKKIWAALSLGPLSVRKGFWEQNITLPMRSGCLSSSNPSASHVGPVVAFCPLRCSGTGDSWPCLLSPMAFIVRCGPSTQPQALAAPASSSFSIPKMNHSITSLNHLFGNDTAGDSDRGSAPPPPSFFFFFLIFLFIYLASCGMWDFVSRPGMEPVPPALEAWNLNHWTTREIPTPTFLMECLRSITCPMWPSF